MKLLNFFATFLAALIILSGNAFAAMPDISAGEMYFDITKGGYVLKGKVRVAANNRNFKAIITADEAFVSITNQNCRAQGHVKLTQDNITLSCDSAFIQWQTKSADVTGSVRFANKKIVTIDSDNALFNWQEKIIDFYGNVKLKPDKSLKFADGVQLDGKDYEHVRYNLADDTILALDKKE